MKQHIGQTIHDYRNKLVTRNLSKTEQIDLWAESDTNVCTRLSISLVAILHAYAHPTNIQQNHNHDFQLESYYFYVKPVESRMEFKGIVPTFEIHINRIKHLSVSLPPSLMVGDAIKSLINWFTNYFWLVANKYGTQDGMSNIYSLVFTVIKLRWMS